MMFLLFNLLQPEQRLSAVVVIVAVLVFIAGVSLLVYFYRRYKRVEREAEDDWDASRHSLFVNVKPPAAETERVPKTAKADTRLDAVTPTIPAGGTREFTADMKVPSFTDVQAHEQDSKVEPEIAEELPQPPQSEPRLTEVLTSPSVPLTPVSEPEPEVSGRRDLLGKEPEPERELPKAAVQPPATVIPKPEPVSPKAEPQPPATVIHEPLTVARVEQKAQREQFESPRIERISHREPYERPTIVPLAPREATGTRELRSPQIPTIDRSPKVASEEPMRQGTVRLGSSSGQIPPPAESPRETRELAGETVAAISRAVPDRTVSATASSRVHRAGSILGLPAEASREPLILGEPARPSGEVGIGGLTNYGKDVGPKGGRAGTIALLIVLVLLGGAVALYLLVPSIHSSVGGFVARVRGTDTQAALEAAMKPKAQVIPSTRPEVNKNMVTARGAVDNISDEPLENLSVEVSLQRGGGESPEIRTVPVNPNPLPARERGMFEFEYDGKRDTGFLGYTITRLFSNGAEIRFRSPGQK